MGEEGEREGGRKAGQEPGTACGGREERLLLGWSPVGLCNVVVCLMLLPLALPPLLPSFLLFLLERCLQISKLNINHCQTTL